MIRHKRTLGRPRHGAVVLSPAIDVLGLAEGVETESEFEILKGAGVHLFQGYWLARPEFERLPSISKASLAAAGCAIKAA